jgi:hypothetical protein
MTSMGHAEAIAMGAAEKYLLDELSGEERSQYEEHFFDCAVCAEDLKAAVIFVENAKTVLRDEPKERRDASMSPRPWWGLFWPLPAGAMAAGALLVGGLAYQSMVVVPSLRSELSRAQAPQAAGWHFLSISRAEPQVIVVSRDQRMLGLTLSKSSDRSFPRYRREVRDARDRVVESAVVGGPSKGEELQVLLPVVHLPSGSYVVALAGLESPGDLGTAAGDVIRYHFTLRHEE